MEPGTIQRIYLEEIETHYRCFELPGIPVQSVAARGEDVKLIRFPR
jgi:hypothetical protein